MRRRKFLTSVKVLAKLFRGWGKCSIGWIAESWRFSCWIWVLKDYLGKLTSRRLVKELFSPTQIGRLQKVFSRDGRDLINTTLAEANSTPDIEIKDLKKFAGNSDLLKSLEQEEKLGQAGLEFYNLCWPHPSQSLLVDTQPAFGVEAAWTFESLPKEHCISGLSGLVQEQGSYFVGLPARALKKCPNFFNASSPEQSLSQKCKQPWAALFEKAWGLPGIVSRSASANLLAPVANSSSLHCWPEAQCQATFILIEVWNFALQYLVLAVIAFMHKRFELLCATAFK